ncbi:hypothetical protein ANN_11870 [Periplaneta americana]|uniref:Uncharacterized protein n=1 Tax=Periplaneta americana TaxID=6978 RepID=A0ABQ8T7P7_PERAM|nr:hypothetical protein ANN_11870 [Periplaneta americana]
MITFVNTDLFREEIDTARRSEGTLLAGRKRKRMTSSMISVAVERWIGYQGPVPWPARSPDLNPLDFFLINNPSLTICCHLLLPCRKTEVRRSSVTLEPYSEEETMLRDMLLALNDSCKQYAMKINGNKTETMVVGRKVKKINMRILNEVAEQVDNFKYLGCTISSNTSCCQEVRRRIAMAKEAFNRKRNIFCGPLGKERRKITQ